MWFVWANRALKYRRYVILGLVAVMAFMAVFGNRLLKPLAPLCPAAPTYHADVPSAVRAELDTLQKKGLLYCQAPPDGLKSLDGPVYWGTDGVNSLLFYQVHAAADIAQMRLDRYAYGEDFEAGPRGGPPPDGFKNELGGRPVYTNQAAPDATYYHLILGGPADYDFAVNLDLSGLATENTGLAGRSFWRDLDKVVRAVQGKTGEELRRTDTRVAIPLVPDRWLAQRQRTVIPAVAGEKGAVDLGKLRTAQFPQPTIYQVYNGTLGSGVWVAGLPVGGAASPALTLVPPNSAPITQLGDTQTWSNQVSAQRIASFAFPALVAGTTYTGQYWADGNTKASRPPDQTFTVTAP